MYYKVFINANEKQYARAKGFNNYIGYMAWNIAVNIAPYDTGNLRTSISLKNNTNNKKTIMYDGYRANYVKYLEEGTKNSSKHKGFIGIDTTTAITENLVSYIENGNILGYLSKVPSVKLKTSTNVFGNEKSILRSMNKNTSKITAYTRKRISMYRNLEETGKPKRKVGIYPIGVK